jgi:prolyl oligopeptidase
LTVLDEPSASPRVSTGSKHPIQGSRATASSGYSVSPDGAALAYTTSDGGADRKTIRVRSVVTGEDLPESIGLVKFTGIGWSHDGHGFYYSRYPVREDGHGGDDSRQVSIWYHSLGTPQESDQFIYAVTNHPTRNPYATVSDDGQQIVIHISDGYAQSGVFLLNLNDPDADATPLLADYDARYDYLGNEGDTYYFLTTADAGNGRIIAVDRHHPKKSSWRTIVAEANEAVDGVQFSSHHFFIRYLKDAHSVVRVADTDGHVQSLELPGMGEAVGFDGDRDARVLYYAYTDYLTPQAIYRLDCE